MARPLKYKTVAELQSAIDQYFEDCEGKPLLDANGEPYTDKNGAPIIVGKKPPTVTGLALALGFTGRKQLLDYQGRAAFCNTITRAKSRCEEYAETRLYDRDGSKGAQFSLSHNFGWIQSGMQQNDKPNNLLQAIQEAGEINTDDLPEVQ